MNPIHPYDDTRVSHQYATLNGKRYHYLLGIPLGGYRETIFLIHGWPDLAIGWRYQIPLLLEMGFRVVSIDIMGFGRTDAPIVSLESHDEAIAFYTFKRASDDFAELARQLGSSRITVGGHDWGGAIAYRFALWHPELVMRIFVICTPYNAPASQFMSIESIVKTKLPNFAYQIQLASGIVEKHVQTQESIKKLLNALYGGVGPNREFGFEAKSGLRFEDLDKLTRTKLLSEEMLEYYANEYSRNGMHGTLCWYRNREQNFRDELQLRNKTITVPVLFVQATKDAALPPAMSKGMERNIPHLTRTSVTTGHWALWEAPEEINKEIKEWLEKSEGYKSNL